MTQEDNNFFEGAKFGDKFIDNGGKILIYHYSEPHTSSDGKVWKYHYLMREPVNEETEFGNVFYHPYHTYVFKDGVGINSALKYYDIEKIKIGCNNKFLIIRKL